MEKKRKKRKLVHSTKDILLDLEKHVKLKKPFSTIRLGDGVLGVISVFFAPDIVETGKWSGERGLNYCKGIFRGIKIDLETAKIFTSKIIKYCNEANYIDSYDAFKTEEILNKSLGPLAKKWQEIHKIVGISNVNYCNPFLHYFSVVEGEYNLFDIIKNRKVLCIGPRIVLKDKLKEKSKCKSVDWLQVLAKGNHYRLRHREIVRKIRRTCSQYDVCLVGAGFLGKFYCGLVKSRGGRAFDVGRLFDLWAGRRKIDSRSKRIIRMNTQKMLCERLLNHNGKVW